MRDRRERLFAPSFAPIWARSEAKHPDGSKAGGSDSSRIQQAIQSSFSRLELTYMMLVEHYDDRLRDGNSDTNKILDERIKARHIVEWAESLPPDYDLATAIVKFYKMPKPGDDTFAQE